MKAILFGSIGSLADTSELQRRAFNEAFQKHHLAWNWDQPTYAKLLAKSGGERRIAEYAESRNESVDAAAVHEAKSALFQGYLTEGCATARPGVKAVIQAAKADGVRLGFVTTTARDNVDGIVRALEGSLDADDFDLILSRSDVQRAKPAADVYELALTHLSLDATDCVAIEDNVGGVAAAGAAGIRCFAFPSENNADHDFSAATATIDHLDYARLSR